MINTITLCGRYLCYFPLYVWGYYISGEVVRVTAGRGEFYPGQFITFLSGQDALVVWSWKEYIYIIEQY